jgi:hypothetical protein
VFVRQSPGTAVLTVILEQGENLSGPYAGTATGPNGFTCSIGQRDRTVRCPAISLVAGTTVTIKVAVTIGSEGPNAATIFRSSGCDSRPYNSCTVTMTGDRTITLAVGCTTCVTALRSPAAAGAEGARGTPLDSSWTLDLSGINTIGSSLHGLVSTDAINASPARSFWTK